MKFPIQSKFRISSPYGQRWGELHNGIDIAVIENTPVYAPAPGIVAESYWNPKGGNQMLIDHPGGWRTGYAHLNKKLNAGTKVKRNQLIAYSGNTGQSSGAHLHFTLRHNGELVDPLTKRWTYPKGLQTTNDYPIKRTNYTALLIPAGLAVLTILILRR